MSNSSLNLPQLAQYLRLPERQVQKLVDRGSIPGRRVHGEWQFSMDEVHRWMETRIGACDEQELAEMECALADSNQSSQDDIVRISSLILPEAVEIPLQARTRDSVIRRMAHLAERTGNLWDADKMIEAVKKREELHTTALDNGVALLHPRRPMPTVLGSNLIVLGCTATGIPFGGGFGNLTDVFYLILSLDDRAHLRVLARLSRLITAPGFLDSLRDCQTPEAAITLTRTVEDQIC